MRDIKNVGREREQNAVGLPPFTVPVFTYHDLGYGSPNLVDLVVP